MQPIVPDPILTFAIEVLHAKRISQTLYVAHCTGKRHRRGDRRPSLNCWFSRRDHRWHLECESQHCDVEYDVLRPHGTSFAKLLRNSPAPLRYKHPRRYKHGSAADLRQALRWLAFAVFDGEPPPRTPYEFLRQRRTELNTDVANYVQYLVRLSRAEDHAAIAEVLPLLIAAERELDELEAELRSL